MQENLVKIDALRGNYFQEKLEHKDKDPFADFHEEVDETVDDSGT